VDSSSFIRPSGLLAVSLVKAGFERRFSGIFYSLKSENKRESRSEFAVSPLFGCVSRTTNRIGFPKRKEKADMSTRFSGRIISVTSDCFQRMVIVA
jgi:hypothetical protein